MSGPPQTVEQVLALHPGLEAHGLGGASVDRRWVKRENVKLEAVSFTSKALSEPLPVKRWTCFGE